MIQAILDREGLKHITNSGTIAIVRPQRLSNRGIITIWSILLECYSAYSALLDLDYLLAWVY